MGAIRREYERTVRRLGVPASVTSVKTSTTTSGIQVGIAGTGQEIALVNEYGVGSRIVTILAADVPFTVAKFDVVEVAGERLVLDFVRLVHEPGSGDVMGYRGIVRGTIG